MYSSDSSHLSTKDYREPPVPVVWHDGSHQKYSLKKASGPSASDYKSKVSFPSTKPDYKPSLKFNQPHEEMTPKTQSGTPAEKQFNNPEFFEEKIQEKPFMQSYSLNNVSRRKLVHSGSFWD